jgi:lysozyme
VKALVQLAACAAISAAVIALLLYRGIVRFNYPDLRTYPIQGVDVSHHQGEIDWTQLQGPAVQFAYIKASEGATFRDAQFAANWQGAVTAGVTPGAYHFFTLCRSGAEQARNFFAALADDRHGTSASGRPRVRRQLRASTGAGACPELARSSI